MCRSKNAVLHSVSVLAEQASLALSNVVGLALRGTMRSMVDSLRLRRGFLTCAAGEIDKPRCVSYFSTTPKEKRSYEEEENEEYCRDVAAGIFAFRVCADP